MNTRPDRLRKLPTIDPMPLDHDGQIVNWQRVYSGALGDNLTLEGGQGVYRVKLGRGMAVEKEGGISIDWSDPQIAEVINQSVAAQVASGTLDLGIGTGIGTSHVYAIHWVPTAQGMRVIPVFEGDARGRLIRYWMSAGVNSIADCVHGIDGTRQSTQVAEGATLSPYISCSDSVCQLSIDPTSMNLVITLTKTNAGADSVYFYVRVDDFGVIPSTGYSNQSQD